MKDIALIVGKNIRAFREAKGISVEVLARVMNISPRQVYNYERGKNITFKNLEVLAEILHISPMLFLEDVDEESINYQRRYLKDWAN